MVRPTSRPRADATSLILRPARPPLARRGRAVRVGLAILRHGDDPRALALYDDDPLLPRACAGDPGVLAARRIRAWLGACHAGAGACSGR
jgi:hypothetical protein